MDMPVYEFPDEEIDRYTRHGIARAKINQMISIPPGGCIINIESLLEIDLPKFY